jgi:hypothetical protein
MRGMPVVQPRAVTGAMRLLLAVAGGLVFIAGCQLFILTERTDRYFAWTVQPAATAAFLGAAYWASCGLELLAARERIWARARVAVPAVLAFTTLTLVATLLHRDRFHLQSADRLARTAAWVWLGIYAAVPLLLTAALAHQLRAPGVDPPRLAMLPPWLRLLVGAQGIVLLLLGAALFLAPLRAAPLWPWTLTALTARAVGAWLVGLGVAAAHVAWENDWARARPALVGEVLLGVLLFVALVRYPQAADWGGVRALLYLACLIATLAIGLYSCLFYWLAWWYRLWA